MYPHSHFLIGLALAEAAVDNGLLSHYQAIICAILAVFVDIDHYIYYIVKKRDLNLWHAWNYCSKEGDSAARTIWHQWPGVIFMIISSIFLFFYSRTWFWVISIAYFSHRLLDYIPIEKSTRVLRFSLFKLYFMLAKEEAIFDIALLVILVFELIT